MNVNLNKLHFTVRSVRSKNKIIRILACTGIIVASILPLNHWDYYQSHCSGEHIIIIEREDKGLES